MTGFSIKLPPFSELKPLHQNWTWQEIQWGKHKGILHAGDAIAYAVERLEEGRTDFEVMLALSIEQPDSWAVDGLVARLCCMENKESTEDIERVWRKTLLKWLCLNKKETKELQQDIEMLYADFDYPEDMTPLIGYMPGNGVSSGKWSIDEALRDYLR